MAVPYQFANIDFSQLAGIGDSIGQGLANRRARKEDEAFKAELGHMMQSGGVNDYNAMAQFLLRHGKTDDAVRLMTSGQEKPTKPRWSVNPLTGQYFDVNSPEAPPQSGAGAPPRGKPPSGYQWKDDGTLEAIAGGPGTRIPAETAGRIAMLDTALSDFDKARAVMEGSWGAKGAAQSLIGMGEIGRAQRQVKSLIEAALRAMTGAAAPETEVSRYMDLYMPNAADTAETAKQKLDLLVGFAGNAKNIITQGRGGDTSPQVRQVPTMNVSPDGAMTPTNPGGFPSQATMMPGAPTNPLSTGPLPFEPDPKKRVIGQVYISPNGKQYLWAQDNAGVGWEPLE